MAKIDFDSILYARYNNSIYRLEITTNILVTFTDMYTKKYAGCATVYEIQDRYDRGELQVLDRDIVRALYG